MRWNFLGFILFAALLTPAQASEITYGLNIQESAFSVVGTITTDGETGGLFDSDVTAYNLTVSIFGSGLTYPLACGTACYATFARTVGSGTPIGIAPFPSGFALFATQQYLLFNFAAENSNAIILGQNTYPSTYVEFYDHFLIDSEGMPDDQGTGAVQVGGGDWYPAVQTAFYPDLGNLQEYSSDGTYIIGTAVTPLPAALPLFATGIGGLGLLGWRRKRKAQAGLS
jgi:hypothetical protein